MLSHMSSMRKILPVLLCLAMLAGGAALYAQDAAAQAPAAPAPEAPAAAPDAAAAPAPPKIDTGDTAWVLVSTALVLLMTAPGVALFYGGMTRSKNALGTILQSFIDPLSDQYPVGAVGVLPRLRARRRPYRR